MQTWLVHMPHPGRLLGEVRARRLLAIQVMIPGDLSGYFINPVMWLLVLLWYATARDHIEMMIRRRSVSGAIALFAGNLNVYLRGSHGLLRKGYVEGVKYALLSPFYWVLMSVAA